MEIHLNSLKVIQIHWSVYRRRNGGLPEIIETHRNSSAPKTVRMLPARPYWSARRFCCKLAFVACTTWTSKNPIKWTHQTSGVYFLFTSLVSITKNARQLLLLGPSLRMAESRMVIFIPVWLSVRREVMQLIPCAAPEDRSAPKKATSGFDTALSALAPPDVPRLP